MNAQVTVDWAAPDRPSNALFQEPWWLDVVAPGAWDAVQVMRNDRVVARLPFLHTRSASGSRESGMPPLTQTLGPWFELTAEKESRRVAQELELMGELIEGLPPIDRFTQRFHFSVTNWLPFFWQDYIQTTRYTYVLADLSDPDAVWRGFQEQARRAVRKAGRSLVVDVDENVDEVYRQAAKTYERQGRVAPFSAAFLARVHEAASARGAGLPLVARDAQGQAHAAIYVVWDERAAYYLLGGYDAELGSGGATSLLFWHAFKNLQGRAAMFDFEGSMLPGIERFFRTFGASQRGYMEISRVSRELAALNSLRDGLHGLSRHPKALGLALKSLFARVRS